MADVAGIIVFVLFVKALLVQIYRIHKRGKAQDLSVWTCGEWVLGMICLGVVSFITDAHWTFKINHVIVGLLHVYLFVLVWWKHVNYKYEMNTPKDKGRLKVYKGGK